MANARTVHLIDASPYVFRAYFATPSSITDPRGHPVNAVYGFTNFLIRYIADERPTHLGIAFDESLTTSFRNDFYPAYKAQRDLPPAELEAQLQACQEVAGALGGATFAHERFEADDLIGTLTHQLRESRHRIVVVSSDKDLAQLVESGVQLFDYAKQVRYRPTEVKAKFGVRPGQIVDFLALAGDSVDNIPGVRGVGAKTAVALLEAFGSLSRLYDRLDRVATLELRGARTLGAKLERERDNAFLSQRLATIARDAPVHARLGELLFTGADPALVDPLFDRLGFDRVRTRIPVWK